MNPITTNIDMERPFIIGIGGGTASGKSLLSSKLKEQFREETAGFLSMDRYYLNADAFPREIRGNYDHPRSLDYDRLLDNLTDVKNGKSIQIPVYDFSRHERMGFTEFITPSVVIIEGLLLFSFRELCDLLDTGIYVDAPADIRLARRILRDCRERGRTCESVISQYLETVAPMHAQFVEPFQKRADLVIPGTETPDKMLELCIDWLITFEQVAGHIRSVS